jgi:hypothetical protein
VIFGGSVALDTWRGIRWVRKVSVVLLRLVVFQLYGSVSSGIRYPDILLKAASVCVGFLNCLGVFFSPAKQAFIVTANTIRSPKN